MPFVSPPAEGTRKIPVPSDETRANARLFPSGENIGKRSFTLSPDGEVICFFSSVSTDSKDMLKGSCAKSCKRSVNAIKRPSGDQSIWALHSPSQVQEINLRSVPPRAGTI